LTAISKKSGKSTRRKSRSRYRVLRSAKVRHLRVLRPATVERSETGLLFVHLTTVVRRGPEWIASEPSSVTADVRHRESAKGMVGTAGDTTMRGVHTQRVETTGGTRSGGMMIVDVRRGAILAMIADDEALGDVLIIVTRKALER
jgi:hypothetical protein